MCFLFVLSFEFDIMFMKFQNLYNHCLCKCHLAICRNSRPEVFCKKEVFLEVSQNSQENTCARVSFLIKMPAACSFIKKETVTQVFSCEFGKFSKNTFSYRTPSVAASASLILFLLHKTTSICKNIKLAL